jgi:DNA (cytosine-5)-methyltransferase 1
MSLRQNKARMAAQWPLDNAITVVLFAGLGGACDGLEEAGCPVAVANNHDEVALAAHAARHPHTEHSRGDIFDVDPLRATRGRRVKVLWASPDCRDHSVAKGGAPRSPRVRSLPWQVCRWAGLTRPEVIFVENVREIRGWGPLIAKRCRKTGRVLKADGSVAAPGERVPVREQFLVRDPQRAGRSFRAWVRHLRGLGYAYEDRDLCCADYGIPTTRRRFFAVARRDGADIRWPAPTHAPRKQSKASGRRPWVPAADIIDWSIPCPSIFGRPKPLAEATMRRIAAGLRRYVLENPEPFLIPVGTQVAGGSKHAIVAAWMVQHNLGVVGHEMSEPLSTLTTAGTQQQIAVAFLQQYYSQGTTSQDCTDPLATVTTLARFGVVTVTLAGRPYAIADIGLRMLTPDEAARAHELTLPRHITVAGQTRTLTKREAMRLIGNSVPKRMARLLAQANAVHALVGRASQEAA